MPKDCRQDARLELAIQAVQSGQIGLYFKVAKLYDVFHMTLHNQLKGAWQHSIANCTKHKLTEMKKDILLQWILIMNNCKALLRSSTVWDMINLLLADCDVSQSSTIGINWVNCFIQHHNTFQTCFSWKYDHQWALCENPSKIQEWFKLIWKTIEEWGITDEDIYNFNETGFIMGIVATAKVITQINKQSHSSLIQSGNCEWVITIETINVSDWVLPSMIIFAGKTHHTNWFINADLSLDWMIAVSDNGWTND